MTSLAVWKFASCDGCQLTLLDCLDELVLGNDRLTVAYFREATDRVLPGPYDVSLVEGSITTAADVERIQHVRRVSGRVIAIGACAIAGGIQALRNAADVDEFRAAVYPHPEYVQGLATSTAISAHVAVDLELPGCPIEPAQLIEAVTALLAGRAPDLPTSPVCLDCKRRGLTCVTVADRIACLGPITRGGCGARCPAVGRGCFGCFGPAESADVAALRPVLAHCGTTGPAVERLLHSVAGPAFAGREHRDEP